MKKYVCVICYITLLFLLFASAFAIEKPKTRDEQRAWEEKYDKRNIRHTAEVQTDTSEDFLKIPESYEDIIDFEVAKTPPTIDFAVIQNLEPEYLPYHLAKNAGGAWGGWGDVTKGPDGCFYYSISNHLSYGAESYINKYDPSTKTQSIVLSAKDLIGWQPDDFGDGKIHGDIDFGPGGDTWMLTYFGPGPKQEEWDTIYKGSWLIRYNCFSGEAEQFGIPLEGASWPYFNYDYKQNLLFGVDHTGSNVIVYDTKDRRMVYGGAPPDNIKWYARCTMIDKETGFIYTTDSNSEEKQIICYKRRNNVFTRMNATIPMNPNTQKRGNLRAHTSHKDKDGAFWCFDNFGTMFRFYPEQDRTEYVCENWGKEGYYTANMAMSPGGRYIYYIPGIGYQYGRGVPVVQYDTRTNKKKVIAFIYDYYVEKYGYGPVRPYGIELDEKGESLCFFANGGFTTPEVKNWWQIDMRRAGIYHLHIPASERGE
ncbi:MAG: hypothetical protein JXB48_07280 [Candidatus Latescibacteria bacterium]|nr:hypothetical protein [Candidatus Latescibacterota bacterium]